MTNGEDQAGVASKLAPSSWVKTKKKVVGDVNLPKVVSISSYDHNGGSQAIKNNLNAPFKKKAKNAQNKRFALPKYGGR